MDPGHYDPDKVPSSFGIKISNIITHPSPHLKIGMVLFS